METIINKDLAQQLADQPEVYKQEVIEISYKENKEEKRLKLRRIYYRDQKNRHYVFMTNNFDITAEEVALIYKKRWQIELLFKKMKQNFQLHYFNVKMKMQLEPKSGVL